MAVTTFDFDPKLTKVLDRLKKDMHAASRAEVLRRAITLLDLANMAEKDGAELIIRKDKKEKQIVVR
jgi:hypothetical protein